MRRHCQEASAGNPITTRAAQRHYATSSTGYSPAHGRGGIGLFSFMRLTGETPTTHLNKRPSFAELLKMQRPCSFRARGDRFLNRLRTWTLNGSPTGLTELTMDLRREQNDLGRVSGGKDGLPRWRAPPVNER